MASVRYADPTDWDWWGTGLWPPHLREFVAEEWPAETVPRSWRLFCEARKAAAPYGWRLATLRARYHAMVAETEALSVP